MTANQRMANIFGAHRMYQYREAVAQRGREYRFGWTVARDGCRPELITTEHERAGYAAGRAHYAALARMGARQTEKVAA